MGAPTLVPAESDFLVAFGVAPIEARPNDGYWRYRFDNGSGLILDFSFCTHDTSVQTRISFEGRETAIVSHEGALEIRILEEGATAAIKVTFEPAGTVTTLVIDVLPEPKVKWASLRV